MKAWRKVSRKVSRKATDLILQLKAGASDGELLNNGYSAESIQAAKETLKLILA